MMNRLSILKPTLRCIAFAGLMLTGLLTECEATGTQKGDQFEGAVWRFRITPKSPRSEERHGAFRVSNDQIFQKETPADKDFRKQVGTNHPKGEKTRMKVTDFRTFVKSENGGAGSQNRMSGTVLLSMNKFGEWSGRFIDSEGHHWEFKCSRIAE